MEKGWIKILGFVFTAIGISMLYLNAYPAITGHVVTEQFQDYQSLINYAVGSILIIAGLGIYSTLKPQP